MGRGGLTREHVVAAAVSLADVEGLAKLTMRRLARELGVEAMSLYHHVANKEDILDGMVDVVFSEIRTPRQGFSWRSEMRARARSAREALGRHAWAVGVMESRQNPGLATLRHHNAVLGCLRGAGFPVVLAGHAYAALDSYIYGFALQESTLLYTSGPELRDIVDQMLPPEVAEAYPHLAELAREHATKPDYHFGAEFDYGLDLLLDGLERALDAEPQR